MACSVIGARTQLWAFIYLPVSLIALGIAALIVRAKCSPFSEEGWEIIIRWQPFMSYLRTFNTASFWTTSNDILRYLPYIACFANNKVWINHLKTSSRISAPAWFQPYAYSKKAPLTAFQALVTTLFPVPIANTTTNTMYGRSYHNSGGFGGGGFSGGGGGAAGGGGSGAG